MHDLSTLAQLEPWRMRHGIASNALDPTWRMHEQAHCDGELWWEGTTKWWMCTKCSYTSTFSYPVHPQAEHPVLFFIKALMAYMAKRQEQQISTSQSLYQALYVAGVALRYAATVRPEALGEYVDNNLVVH